MMRGMFAAISGLKNHQTMLDVTANDIANVNTIGYKSARATFKDTLSQTQRGGSAPGGIQRRRQRRAGRPRRPAGLDRQRDGRRRRSSRPATRSTSASRARASSPCPRPRTARARPEYTRAGNFTTNRDGELVTQDGFYVRGYGVNAGPPPSPNATAGKITIPDTASNLAVGRGRLGELRRRDHRPAHHGRLHPADEVRQPGRPRAQLEQPLAGVAELRHGRSPASPAPAAPA